MGFPILVRRHLYIESGPFITGATSPLNQGSLQLIFRLDTHRFNYRCLSFQRVPDLTTWPDTKIASLSITRWHVPLTQYYSDIGDHFITHRMFSSGLWPGGGSACQLDWRRGRSGWSGAGHWQQRHLHSGGRIDPITVKSPTLWRRCADNSKGWYSQVSWYQSQL